MTVIFIRTLFLVIIFLSVFVTLTTSSLYSDVRCKCICPSTEVVNGSKTERKLYIANVLPKDCTCYGVVLPQAAEDIRSKDKEFCPRCDCRYERRNTTTIRDDPITMPLQSPTPTTTVLNRVGQQQDKWKRSVQEQRRHIYDQHTMLN
ncbi:putative protein 2 isoform X2 [Limulus polyphemus]|uniref:Uncharacterized protein n=1 Tax=Limulus polyphemus TaxID=6850 RepID=A0ABM1T870_LIMPO|nr:putative protein 2 isoform X2 [Limulus polyphemus]